MIYAVASALTLASIGIAWAFKVRQNRRIYYFHEEG